MNGDDNIPTYDDWRELAGRDWRTAGLFTVSVGSRPLRAEAILRHYGTGRYNACSAGSMPTGMPNPAAIATLEARGIDHSFARSKSWDEFAGPDAEAMDIVITVCANAAGETCPVWPGHPHTAD